MSLVHLALGLAKSAQPFHDPSDLDSALVVDFAVALLAAVAVDDVG